MNKITEIFKARCSHPCLGAQWERYKESPLEGPQRGKHELCVLWLHPHKWERALCNASKAFEILQNAHGAHELVHRIYSMVQNQIPGTPDI